MERARRVEGELSGCPGCNGQPLIVEGPDGFRCECSPCRVRLWSRSSRQEAIGDWEDLPRMPASAEPVPEPNERQVAA